MGGQQGMAHGQGWAGLGVGWKARGLARRARGLDRFWVADAEWQILAANQGRGCLRGEILIWVSRSACTLPRTPAGSCIRGNAH